MRITCFDELTAAAASMGPIRVGVVAAHDLAVLTAVGRAVRHGMVEPTLVGDWHSIEALAAQAGVDLSGTTTLHEPDERSAALHVIEMAQRGRIDAVVKGQIRTADLLSIALNRHVGIRRRGLLTHIALFELPGVDRLIYLSDSGVIVYPDLYQKLEIINNAVSVARMFGVRRPKVAILAASETVHPKIPASIDALALAKMAEQGWVENAVVDGPLGLELAISPQAAEIEGCTSPIAGVADVLIVPNVEAGNIVAKGLMYFAHARMAGLVVGAQVPIVISSRADTADTRYLSLALATVLHRAVVSWPTEQEPT